MTALVQERAGRIVIAGDNDGGGCCTLNWAAVLTPRGRLVTSYGKHGREELPTGEDSGVESLALEPNGDILADVGYGNMGCWGTALAMLRPSGQPVPLFGQRVAHLWQGLDFGAFLGDVLVDRNGFTLVGTGQAPCDDVISSRPSPSHGVIARFRTDGQLIGNVVRFRSPIEAVSTFKHGDELLLVTSPPFAQLSTFSITARRLDGSVDPRFGGRGRVRVLAPWRGRNSRDATDLDVSSTPDGELAVLALRDGVRQLRLIRLRT